MSKNCTALKLMQWHNHEQASQVHDLLLSVSLPSILHFGVALALPVEHLSSMSDLFRLQLHRELKIA